MEYIKSLAGWKRSLRIGMKLKCNADWHKPNAIRIIKKLQTNGMALSNPKFPAHLNEISWLYFHSPKENYKFINGNTLIVNNEMTYEILEA